MKVLLVAGTYNRQDGRVSYLGDELADALRSWDLTLFNGGNLSTLEGILSKLSEYQIIIWMPRLDSSVDKFLPQIKKLAPNALLVSSKRIIQKSYTDDQILEKLVQSGSSLGVIIGMKEGIYHFKLMDHLGTIWAQTRNVQKISSVIRSKLESLIKETNK